MSTKCRYGLRALADLAYYGRQGHVPLYQIARRQSVSLKYLEQTFSLLRKAGIVRSVKGAQGGYMLNQEPDQVTLAAIIVLLEGDLDIVDVNSDAGALTSYRRCISDHVWTPLNKKIEQRMQNMTLYDLIQFYDEQQSEHMYYI